MTEAEKQEIVGLVMTQISSQAVDFDIATEEPQANDLLTAVRQTSSGAYVGVTIKWDDVARIATELANQAATRAEQAKTNVENMKSSVEQTVTDFNALADQKKSEVESVYQTDLNELKGDLINSTKTEIVRFTIGKNITIGKVGTTVDLTPETVSSYRYAIYECGAGTEFLLNCLGGVNPRAYAFLDSNNVVLEVATASYQAVNLIVTAPTNTAKIIINDNNSGGVCYIGIPDFYKISELNKKRHSISIYGGVNYPNIDTQNCTIDFDKASTLLIDGEKFLMNGYSNINLLSIDGSTHLLVFNKSTRVFTAKVFNAVFAEDDVLVGTIKTDYDFNFRNAVFPFEFTLDGKTTKSYAKRLNELETSMPDNIVNALINADVFSGKSVEISKPYQYTAWPFVQKLNDKLVCVYSRGLSHEDATTPDIYARTSSNGIIWSDEVKVIATENTRDTITGKGQNSNGDMLVWDRKGQPWWADVVHDLYKTSDGATFVYVTRPVFATVPSHIGDIINVPNVGLMAFYNDVQASGSRTWGIVKSTDDGATWTQTVIESGLTIEECPMEISPVYLGNGKILAMGRQESDASYSMFQIRSDDYGDTWTKTPTNITDINQSTPSLIYDDTSDTLYLYYFQRVTGVLRLRKTTSVAIWDNPTSWSDSEIIARGTTSGSDTGNVNAVAFGDIHIASFYSGNSTKTGIYAAIKKIN